MLKTVAIALTLVLANAAPVMAQTAAPAAAEAKPVIFVSRNDNWRSFGRRRAKAIIDKHIPGMTDNPSISMAAGHNAKGITGNGR